MLSIAPSVVFDGSTREPAGTLAWGALRRLPTATSTRHLGAVLAGARAVQAAPAGSRDAAVALAELRERLSAWPLPPEERIWIAVPASAAAPGLGALLGVARELALPVDGFVDAATASAAALALAGPAIVLELGLHHVAATALERAGNQVSRRRTVASLQVGWLEVLDAWLDLVSRAMVKQTRFDPLHDARTEQQLFDVLVGLALEAEAHGSATARMPGQGSDGPVPGAVELVVSRDQLAQAAQGLRREVMRLLHGLRPAGQPVALLAPRALLQVPGLAGDLDALVGCEQFCLPDGFAAQAVSLLELPQRAPGEPVRLLRRLPARVSRLAEQVERKILGTARSGGPPPSHLLLGGQAYPLAGEPLVVGRAPGDLPGGAASRPVRLADGLAGVSRRHCTFLCAGGEVTLLDHSRFGTFVNGERVAERVRVHAGDRVRLGEPGVELALIAVGEGAT